MSQIFDALQRSGMQLPGFDTAAEYSSDFDAAGLDQVPSFRVEALPKHRLVALTEERSAGTEKIRMLAARLRHLQQPKQIKTLLITSSIKDEGKSLLATNIALYLAKMKQRVLLIDGDCYQGSVASLFGASGLPGLTAWWRSPEPVLTYMRRVNELPLWFLAAGEAFAQSVEMLQSSRLSEMLKQMALLFDWILIDSPPLVPLADSGIWVSLADATLLVVRMAKTPKRLLVKTLSSIDKRKLVGLVLNDCSDPHLGYYAQYYGSTPLAKSNGSRQIVPK